MNPRVRFEDEADAGYRLAGRWYEGQREHLGMEFFDAADETINQIVLLPQAGSLVPRMPADLPVRRRAVPRFPYTLSMLRRRVTSEFSPLLTIAGSLGTGQVA